MSNYSPFRPKHNKLLLLNGPRGCGKDTLFTYWKSLRWRIAESTCKIPLISCVQDWFGITEETWRNHYTSSRKLLPHANFNIKLPSIQNALVLPEVSKRFNEILKDPKYADQRKGSLVSPVLAMILVSEAMHKPVQGRDYFAVERAKLLPPSMSLPTTLYVDTSCGFQEELSPRALNLLAERGYTPDNIFLLQIRKRGPQNFEGDSRQWVEWENMKIVENSGSEIDFLAEATNVVLDWVNL